MRPLVEARDNRDEGYLRLGGFLGLAGSEGPTTMIGGLTLSLPPQHVSLLRVRMTWAQGATSVWGRPAHELQITF